MSEVKNWVPLRERTLLMSSLMRSREAVLIPTLPGYVMFVSEVGVRFVGAKSAHDFRECDALAAVGKDVIVEDDVECVGDFY